MTRASEKLHVSQPTISGQIRELEAALGEKLLRRSGRGVVLTDVGRTVYDTPTRSSPSTASCWAR